MSQNVKVMVRCRPFNQKQDPKANIVHINEQLHQLIVSRSKGAVEQQKIFTFDHIFGIESTQNQVYEQSAFLLVENVLQGYNGTIFAYGQTGCGKTYTMTGGKQQEVKGIIPRTFNHILTRTAAEKQKQHLLHCSYIEIYNQQVYDLFQKKTKTKLQVKQAPGKGTFIKDQKLELVKSVDDIQKFFDLGSKNRAIRQTSFNKLSSRSHCIFSIYVESSQNTEDGNQIFKAGKLNLVDLAGSQRQSKLKMSGQGLKETTRINLSLSALGNVISALVDGKAHHIPYRDSKLTRLLQDSLGGNTKTVMVATISPSDLSFEQTLSTLRYASRTKFIKNKPTVNQDPKDTLLRQYAQQIKRLKILLQQLNPGVVSDPINKIPDGTQYSNIRNNLNQQQRKSLTQTQQQKQMLRKKLLALQQLLKKQQIQEDASQIQKITLLKDKLKQQQWKQQQYLIDKQKRQQQLLTLQTNYKSLNQEVDLLRQRFNQLKVKYMQSCQQNKDLRKQFQIQKQDLLNTIRQQELQISKYKGMCEMVFTERQIDQIITKSRVDQVQNVWSITPFLFKQNTIIFPQATANSLGQLVKRQKNNKNMFVSENILRNYTDKKQKTQSISSAKRPIYNTKQSFGVLSQDSNNRKRNKSNSNLYDIKSIKQRNSIIKNSTDSKNNKSKFQQLQTEREKSRQKQRQKRTLQPMKQKKKLNIDIGKLKLDILSQLAKSRTRQN